ncbi:tyrosine-protein kinase, partial [Klebsiella aerogenes]|nr:tyrosine-protein kinase [Klebsiella aerogenes]
NDETPKFKLRVDDEKNYTIIGDEFELRGEVGQLLNEHGISVKVENINAEPGTVFNVAYVTRLKAITTLQNLLNVSDQGKDTGILNLSLTG